MWTLLANTLTIIVQLMHMEYVAEKDGSDLIVAGIVRRW